MAHVAFALCRFSTIRGPKTEAAASATDGNSTKLATRLDGLGTGMASKVFDTVRSGMSSRVAT